MGQGDPNFIDWMNVPDDEGARRHDGRSRSKSRGRIDRPRRHAADDSDVRVVGCRRLRGLDTHKTTESGAPLGVPQVVQSGGQTALLRQIRRRVVVAPLKARYLGLAQPRPAGGAVATATRKSSRRTKRRRRSLRHRLLKGQRENSAIPKRERRNVVWLTSPGVVATLKATAMERVWVRATRLN
jgi:hypothetical protein